LDFGSVDVPGDILDAGPRYAFNQGNMESVRDLYNCNVANEKRLFLMNPTILKPLLFEE
jgi:hypothetical protein